LPRVADLLLLNSENLTWQQKTLSSAAKPALAWLKA
jgi:hypothetical protein